MIGGVDDSTGLYPSVSKRCAEKLRFTVIDLPAPIEVVAGRNASSGVDVNVVARLFEGLASGGGGGFLIVLNLATGHRHKDNACLRVCQANDKQLRLINDDRAGTAADRVAQNLRLLGDERVLDIDEHRADTQTGGHQIAAGGNMDTESPIEPFLANIVKTLTKNGFPEKRVTLPLERMYEVAHQKGLNFNKALVLLEERGISHEKTSEKIIFFPKQDFAAMMEQAQKIFAEMTDEQRNELMKKAREMGLTT